MSEIHKQRNESQGQQPPKSQHSLSRQLEELAEGENSFIMTTENPQIMLDGQSHLRASEQNLTLAQSELIQRPIQQHIQKVQNAGSSNLENSAQQGSVANHQAASLRINQGLRASLPVLLTHQNPIFAQQHSQNLSNRLNQPATTMARPQSSQTQFAFPQNSNFQQQGQRVTLIQAVGQQGRASSTSPPPKITFNYNVTNRIPQQPRPQPQPQQQIVQPRPQLQPNQTIQNQVQANHNNQLQPQGNQINQAQLRPIQPQPQVIIVPPPQNQQVVYIPQNPSQPQFILPNQQINQIQSNNQNQVIVWQQQYFFIVEKFQFYYQRMQIIHKKCIYLHEAINNTTKLEELQLLKTESNDLLLEITKTQQELAEAVQRNRGYLAQSATWRQKYQQLVKAFEALKQNHNNSVSSLQEKLTVLSKQLIDLENGYNSAVQQSKEESARAQGLEKQLLRMKDQLKKAQNASGNQSSSQELQKRVLQLSKLIEQKNTVINNLRKSIQDKKSTGNSQNTNISNSQATASILEKELRRVQEELIINQDLIVELRAENDKLKSSLKSNADVFEEKNKKYALIISDYEKRINQQAADIGNYQILIQQKNAEIATRKPITNNSAQNNSQNSEVQLQNRRLQHQLSLYEQSHLGQIKMFNARLQQLTQRLRLASSQRESILKSMQQKTALLQSDLNRKDGTIRNLRDRILELEEEKRIRDLDRKYESKPNQSSPISSQELSSLKRQLNDKINQIEELQAQITEYKRMVNQYEDTISVKKHQINGLRRELEDKLNRSQDSTQLNSQLLKKQSELSQIKSRMIDLEKLAGQNELLKLQKNSLSDEVQRKLGQLSQANDRIYMFQKKIRELEGLSRQSAQVGQLSDENELLRSAISKKDQQIAKLRQTNQLLQTNVQELQLEVDKLRSKLSSGQKSSQFERSDLKNKLLSMQLKITEYERKSAGLEEVRVIMSQQISTLTTQINLKFQQIQRIESQLKQERARSKSIEAQLHSQIQQNDFSRGKLKQWQRKYQSLAKELQAESQKKRDLTNTKKNELFNLNNRYIQLQNASKNKDLRIRELQKMVQSLNSKINTFDHNLQEIQYLKHKIVQYEHKINQQGYRFSNKYIDSEPSQIFERKVIYQLKAENELLRRQLGFAPKQQVKDFNVPERDNQGVQERLNDFNKKLQEIISQHGNIDFTLNSEQLYKRFQRDRRVLIQKHNQQISQLKVRILQLENRGVSVFPKKHGNINNIFSEQLDFYKQKNQQLQERVENHIKVNRQLKESIEALLRNHNGEPSILYYKEQLEKSSDTIANLQKQLKKANQQLKKLREQAGRNNSRVASEPNIENEAKYIQLTRRVSQLTLQISLFEKEKITREETIQKYESQTKRSRLLLEQLRVTKDQLQRTLKQRQNNYNDQVTRLTNKLRINQSQIERLQQMLNKRQENDSGETRNFKSKILQLQDQNKKLKARVEQLIISEEKIHRQLARFQNQVQMLLGEIQRLKESLDVSSKRIRDSELQLQTLRLNNADYEARLKSMEGQKEGFSYKQLQLQQQVARWTNQIKLLQAEIDRLNQFTQKKVSEKDSQINRLKLVISQKIEVISQFQDQIRELKVFSFKSNQTAQEIFHLKEEINILHSSLNFKSTQSQNRLKQIRQLTNTNQYLQQQCMVLKRNTEHSSSQLQSFIASLQSQLVQSKKAKDSLAYDCQMKVRSFESQIKILRDEKDQDIASLRSKLSILEGGSRTSQSTYQSKITELKQLIQSLQRRNQELQYSISTIKASSQSQTRRLSSRLQASQLEIEQKDFRIASFIEQLQRLQMQIQAVGSRSGEEERLSLIIQRSVSTIEFLRNLLIEIQTLLQEDRKQAFQRVFGEIEVGLEEIRNWNSIL